MKKLKVEASPYSENMCSPENDPTKKNRANINSHKLLTVSHKWEYVLLLVIGFKLYLK